MRAVRVPFSPGRPSRLKKEPGIFPEAYMRSSTSTVSGRKSTSRRLPATAVQRTIVSPWRTTTAPEACLAILPVSNEISLPAISTETRVTALLLILTTFPLHPSVGGAVFFLSLYPNVWSLADATRSSVRQGSCAPAEGLPERALHSSTARFPLGRRSHARVGESHLGATRRRPRKRRPWARSPRAVGCSHPASRERLSGPRWSRMRRHRSRHLGR